MTLLTPEQRQAILSAPRAQQERATAKLQIMPGHDPIDTRGELNAIAKAMATVCAGIEKACQQQAAVTEKMSAMVSTLGKSMDAGNKAIAALKLAVNIPEGKAADLKPLIAAIEANTEAQGKVAAVLAKDRYFIEDEKDRIIGMTTRRN